MEDETEGYTAASDYIDIDNEYANVRLRKVQTKNGSRLEIFSPKLGYRSYLDPVQLESLTWVPKKIFDKFLETPYGA